MARITPPNRGVAELERGVRCESPLSFIEQQPPWS